MVSHENKLNSKGIRRLNLKPLRKAYLSHLPSSNNMTPSPQPKVPTESKYHSVVTPILRPNINDVNVTTITSLSPLP